jgi:acyl transferase domain-containing protein/acyl carrier protein
MEKQESLNNCSSTDIAVVGMSCRFPGANTVEEFWKNLSEGVESIVHFSDADLKKQGVEEAVLNDPAVVKSAARINDIDLFDASYFGYSPREAEAIDPQQRIFLECAHEALERSGHDPDRFAGLIGVYGGSGVNTYLMRILAQPPSGDAAHNLQATVGNDKDYLCTRVSYKLNLRGPSVCIQTACSTSLVAIHMACQGLIDYECDMALAGGVSVRSPQPYFYRYLEGSIMSPDGHCRAFDAEAKGTVFGNGAGILALRRLEDALKDGDTVLAVIKGSAINNDGAGKVGYTAPGVEGHVDVIRTAWARAGVDPASISLLEAHGTGTPLGDPIELSALTQAFQSRTEKTGFCALGSVKTNIGHLDTAAGAASMIKTVMALDQGAIPPSLNFKTPNPQMEMDRGPFFVNTQFRTWDQKGPRRAAVSSLGIGGTNAHVVLEEAPQRESSAAWSNYHLVPLSARTDTALNAMTEQLCDFCAQNPDLSLADLAFTYQVGKRHMAQRRVILCNRKNDSWVPELSSPNVISGVVRTTAPRIVFMFPGQGSQYPNMARDLYEANPFFKKTVDSQLIFIKSEFNLDLREIMFPSPNKLQAGHAEVTQTAFAQPALFIVEYALAQLLISWGIRPDAMIGHSLGEFVAACVAGVFSIEQALRVVVNRGRLMQQQAPGAMLAVPLSEKAVNRRLREGLSIAVVNGPSACVVSGPTAAIEELKQSLTAEAISSHLLETSHAYHSQTMEGALAPFKAVMAREKLQAPKIPYMSNVTGSWIEIAQATDAAYWAKQLRETVRFGNAVEEILKMPNTLLLEVGPGQALSALSKQQFSDAVTLATLPVRKQMNSGKNDVEALLTAIGKLWVQGVAVQWEAVHQGEQRRRVPVPTYPFEKQRYWIGGEEPIKSLANAQQEVKREALDQWFYLPTWQQTPPAEALPQRTLPENGCWLILMDGTGLGDQLGEQLEAAGQKVISIRTDPKTAKGRPLEYVFSTRSKENVESLMKELSQSGLRPHTIVNFWTTAPDAVDSGAATALEQFTSLLELVQAISTTGRDASMEMFLISNGFSDFAKTEQARSYNAPLVGAAQVVSQECPGLQCRCIQISSNSQGQIHQLIDEMKAANHSPIVSYALGQRWSQAYSKALLPDKDVAHTPLRMRGTYLITGGLGGLGLVVAEFLATELEANLVLVNSTPFLDREKWDEQIKVLPENDRVRAQIEKILELESLGSEVLVLNANVANVEEVERAFLTAASKFGKIDGIFHLAGVPGAGLVQFKNADSSARVFQSKVFGTEVLAAMAERFPVEFMVMFSSITSVTGGIGQVDYCAASRFLDAVAQSGDPAKNTRFISIAWDAWQSDKWQDPALSAFPKLRDLLKMRRKQFGITSTEGMAVLRRVLASSFSHIIVSTQDLHTAIESHDKYSRSVVSEQSRTERAPRNAGTDSGARAGYVAPRNPLEEQIAELWEKILGTHPIGIHDDFIELGGHSLLAIELTARLRETFHTDMPLKAIFESRTIAALASMIAQEKSEDHESAPVDIEALFAQIESLSPEEVQAQIKHLQQ